MLAADKARNEFKVNKALALGNKEHYGNEVKKSEKQLDKLYKKINKLSKEGKIEKGSRITSKKMAEIQNWVKAHPGKSSAIAASAIAAGAGIGYGAKKLRNKD